jgi:hypothetical protein
MPRFDTSFNFGANVKSKTAAKPKGAAKKPRAGKPRSKSQKHFGAMYGS